METRRLFLENGIVPLNCQTAASSSICRRFKRTGKRSEIYLATKFGGDTKRGDPKEVRAAIEKSLKQLDVEYVDLYYSHRFVFSKYSWNKI